MFTETVPPFANCDRPAGFCNTTWPSANVLSITSGPRVNTKPAPSTAARAACSVRPTTGGTSIVVAASAKVMVSPATAVSPPPGDCVCTNPTASHTPSAGVTTTTKPACSNVDLATSHVWPATGGTTTALDPPMVVRRKITAPIRSTPAVAAPTM